MERSGALALAGRHLHAAEPDPIATRVASGSNSGFGSDFSPFGINGLEWMDQNSATWNQIHEWLSQLDAVRQAAWGPLL